jgi:hypothetical protein
MNTHRLAHLGLLHVRNWGSAIVHLAGKQTYVASEVAPPPPSSPYPSTHNYTERSGLFVDHLARTHGHPHGPPFDSTPPLHAPENSMIQTWITRFRLVWWDSRPANLEMRVGSKWFKVLGNFDEFPTPLDLMLVCWVGSGWIPFVLGFCLQ